MHFSDIETAYKNDQYPDAECMLTYPGEVKDNRPFTPAGVNLKPITITRNGGYNPADFDADGFSWVDAEIHPTNKLVETITTNGDHDYTGDYKDATITVDVHPTEKLEETLDERKTYNFVGEFKDAEITVDVPYTNIHVVSGPVASFEGEDLPLKSLTASIVPVQDLHGYDSSWAGGAGKNKLPLTVDNIKKANSSITWSGNEATKSGVTFKIETDNNGNVSGVKLNGTATDDIQFLLGIGLIFNGDYILNGGLSANISVAVQGKVLSAGADRTFTDDGTTSRTSWIFVENGTVCNNVVKPMVRLASVSDSTFAPYSNICPISGWTEEVVTVADDTTTPTVEQTYTIPFTDSQGQSVEVFGGEIDVINGVVTPCPYYASYNGEQLTGEWISDRDVYSPNTSPTIGAQVVNIGATGTPFYTQPTSIKSLDGENNIYANTGDVYVEYQTEWTGESSIVYNAENLLVADVGGEYITNNLDLPLNSGDYYIGELNDITSGDLVPFIIKRDANTSQSIILSLGNDVATLTLTNTTASLSSYGGSYRKIYLRLSEVVNGQLY